MSPVWITGNGTDDTPLTALWGSSAWSTDHANWQADRRMGEADRQDGKQSFTDNWIADRAAMLDAIKRYNVANATGNVISSNGRVLNAKNVYVDIASNTTLTEGPGSLPARYVKFGDSTNDTLLGESMEDHLYGGAGDDTLRGQGGDDHLEGGDGTDTLNGGSSNDTLHGGAGIDTYLIDADSGIDTITHSEAVDVLKLAGRTLDGAGELRTSADGHIAWVDDSVADVQVTYLYDEASRELVVAAAGSTVFVKEFVDGDLGLHLPQAPQPQEPTPPPPTQAEFDLLTTDGATRPETTVSPTACPSSGACACRSTIA